MRSGDDSGTCVPLVVPALLAANLVVFGFELWLVAGEGGGSERMGRLVETWGLVPREFLRGATDWFWLTPFTALFMHGGILHLAANLVVLAVFGSRLEARIGPGRFVVLYAACGAVAAAAQVASDPSSYTATIGASGAVSGVLGAWAVSGAAFRLLAPWTEIGRPAAILLAAWVVLQLGSALGAPGPSAAPVAWWAHLGGFAAGALLSRPLWARPPAASRLRI